MSDTSELGMNENPPSANDSVPVSDSVSDNGRPSEVIVYREGTHDDHRFILSSWARSAQQAWFEHHLRSSVSAWPGLTIADIVAAHKSVNRSRVIEILNRLDTRCTVACDVEDQTLIYGFIVWCPVVTHWIYVRDGARRKGLATSLLARTGAPREFSFAGRLLPVLGWKFKPRWENGRDD